MIETAMLKVFTTVRGFGPFPFLYFFSFFSPPFRVRSELNQIGGRRNEVMKSFIALVGFFLFFLFFFPTR